MIVFEVIDNSIRHGGFNESVLIPYNLQLFAKEGPGGEKTEPATDKKLEDARKEGQVAKSKELSQAISLFAFFIILKIFIGNIGTGFLEVFYSSYSKMTELTRFFDDEISIRDFCIYINSFILKMGLILLPIFAAGIGVTVLVEVYQVKWKPTAKPLMPKFSKLNPINGFKRMFSADKLMELLKSLVKLVLLGYLAYSTLKDEVSTLFFLFDMDLKSAIATIGDIAINLGIKISAFYLILGFADYLYQKWKFAEDMKMTKQEVKDEWKNAEGDPQIKGKQKQRMQEASRRRMMQAVPQADVVITNPTHFAVAIKYEPGVNEAPYVVAKGEDFLAAKIKEVARENKVEIVENKPLARMLYYNVDLGAPIPPELYRAVAEILAVIFNARAAG